MEFAKSTPKRASNLGSNLRGYTNEEEKHLKSLMARYPFVLQIYDKPPQGDISLENFVDYAMERLKVLRLVESIRLKNNSKKLFHSALADTLQKEGLWGYLKKTPPKHSQPSYSDYLDRQKDHISHFVLRLTYCKTEELRNWFMKQEFELFEFRFDNESQETLQEFLQVNGLFVQPIPPAERSRLHENIRAAFQASNRFITEDTAFYKVPFTEVLDMVEKRRIYLEGGFGYIPLKGMVSVISTHFRDHLKQALKICCEWLPNLEDEENRLYPWIDTFYMRYLGKDYSNTNDSLKGVATPDNIDSLSEDAFPLCMHQIHTAFRRDHHLKYNARLQYSLFLKGIGMSLEDVLMMWKEEFTKVIDGDKFDKQYSYNIRHSYGKEGKRANYTPFSCMKVINGLPAPGAGEHHGCPFRNLDMKLLKQKLQQLKISESGIKEITSLASKGHFQLGCTRYFEIKKNVSVDQPFNHPNEYFEKAIQQNLTPSSGTTKTRVMNYKEKPTNVYQHQISQNSQPSQSFEDQMDACMSEMDVE